MNVFAQVLIIFGVLLLYIGNIGYQMRFIKPRLLYCHKREREALDEKHAHNGTTFSSRRMEDDKEIQIRHQGERFKFYIFSIVFPLVLLQELRKLILG